MLGGMEVLSGMLVLRRIAAADVTANLTHPQLYPAVANLEALFAPLRMGFYILNLINVRAFRLHFPAPVWGLPMEA